MLTKRWAPKMRGATPPTAEPAAPAAAPAVKVAAAVLVTEATTEVTTEATMVLATIAEVVVEMALIVSGASAKSSMALAAGSDRALVDTRLAPTWLTRPSISTCTSLTFGTAWRESKSSRSDSSFDLLRSSSKNAWASGTAVWLLGAMCAIRTSASSCVTATSTIVALIAAANSYSGLWPPCATMA